MPPKQRLGSVAKQCEECGGSNPVACKICTACGADFYASANEKPSSPEEFGHLDSSTERRRSERVKREKPDYYDALEFENKRKTSTPTRDKARRERVGSSAGRSPKVKLEEEEAPRQRGTGAKRGPKPHSTNAAGRATLTWKKGKGFDEEDEDKERKKRKRKRDDAEDDMVHIMDEMAPEKTLQSQISLAEINRKLAGVMYQP